MSKPRSLSVHEIWQQLKMLRVNLSVAKNFKDQVRQIDFLLNNDKTGLVSTILDFMIHSATVDMKIETQNETLNNVLKTWQKTLLNKNTNIDIPRGLRALSTENFRERWTSSLLALKVQWGTEDFGASGSFIIPKKMWFVNGGAVETEADGALNTRTFFIKTKDGKKPLKNTSDTSIFIRKPYTAWHNDTVTPYLVKRGTIFNALMKNAITQKQSDVIEAIMPVLLQLKAGNDQLALEGLNPSEEDFKKLKDKFIEAKEKFENGGNFGDIIASLRHDVNLDYLIPDLTKIFDEKIVKSTDRNLLASLGLIELEGFSGTRQEAILNPKVLIEEVQDAVNDWANLLEDVMIEMLERNKTKHRNISNNEIKVIPGTIKAFITDDMRSMLRSLYDRGIISKQNAVEDIGSLNFEVQVDRRIKEEERDLQTILKPPLIQNLESNEDTDDTNLEDQDKKPDTPESDNFNQAILEHYGKKHLKKKKKKKDDPNYRSEDISLPLETIDQLPEDIKSILSLPAQLLWLKSFNKTYNQTEDQSQATTNAWEKVSEQYEKTEDKEEWIKKAKVEDYKNEMSSFAYKLFQEMYETALEHSPSTQNALQTALTIIERVCTRNKEGIWVKDKTLTKAQMEKLDKPDFVGRILDLELKEKKLKLLDKLLENN